MTDELINNSFKFKNIELPALAFDILLTICYLENDRKSSSTTKTSLIGIFLRGSALSQKKTFMKKYDTYRKYPKITNEIIQTEIETLKDLKLIKLKNEYSLTPLGKDFIINFKPDAFKNPYLRTDLPQPEKYIGQYATYSIAKSFKKKSLNEILDKIEQGYAKTTPYSLNDEQERAWSNCYEVLKETFKNLDAKFENLYLIFEYVLPVHKPGTKRYEKDNGIRADIILISSQTVVTLEFKQRDEDYIGFISQANKYATRIRKFHEQSKGMNVYPVLVLTKAKKYYKKHDGVISCSGDKLACTIESLFEEDILKHPDIKMWLDSEFISD